MEAAKAGARILIVEDEPVVGMDLRESLVRMGYSVTDIVSSGDDVINSALKNPPDLVLMDIKLNSFTDGIDAAARLKLIKDLPIIYMTAFADIGMKERAQRTSPSAYLLKPIDEQLLKSSIETALKG